ncbi:hypothetical protein [uncultured Psychrosphaera sp.]|uniref:PKD domain-containing protein n=1 Tax=uncultured Psychrosphaera sp. TaxID=1403522 RepID=UPI002624CE08|nr:hypothetical protein [uncultured Psychrosphaera sp.]
MISRTLYSSIFTSLISLTLVGCGSDSAKNSEEILTTLSVANPIADSTLIADTSLDLSIPTNTCTDSSGAGISYQMGFSNNLGFTFNGSQLSGLPTGVGVVNVTMTCSTATESLSDEFIITVIDFEANPIVEVTAPNLARVDENTTLTAIAEDVNFTGSIVSYVWEQVSGPIIELTSTNTATTRFTAPDTTEQSSAVFSVTVTDNDGDTATDTVEIDLISSLAPSISLSFPLNLGIYNQDSIDMFGNVEVTTGDIIDANGDVTTVDVIVDSVEYSAIITENSWRIEDVTLTETTDIKVLVTATDGFINYEEISLVHGELFTTALDNNVSDIAVNDATDEIYVQANGDLVSDTKFTRFNLTSAVGRVLTVNQPSSYSYSSYAPTSIALDAISNILFVGYSTAISTIDLSTGDETLLSDSSNGAGTYPQFISDLSYNSTTDTLYSIDIDAQSINTVSTTSGNRSDIIVNLSNGSAVATNSTTGDLYYSQGLTTSDQTLIKEYDSSTNSSSTIYNIAAGDQGSPISDIAINEAGEELFFVDGKGSLIKLDLEDDSTTEIISNIFTVEDITNEYSSMVGLHYHTQRDVLIAAGKDVDGTNKLLVIDPQSGNYAKVATGK